MAKKIDKSDIDNLLIYSDDRWSLVEESVIGKTPSQWWTASSAFTTPAQDRSRLPTCPVPCIPGGRGGQQACHLPEHRCRHRQEGCHQRHRFRNRYRRWTNLQQGIPVHRYRIIPLPVRYAICRCTIPDASAIDADDFAAFAAAVGPVKTDGQFTSVTYSWNRWTMEPMVVSIPQRFSPHSTPAT